MLSGAEHEMSDSVARGRAQQVRAETARVLWFLGPRPVSWNGVMRYSLECIGLMAGLPGLTIEPVDIPAAPRSLRRYWTQFVLYPLRAIAAARSSSLIMLYQEDLSFMIPIIRLAGGRVGIVLHHVQHPGRARGLVEKFKNWHVRLMQPLIARADLVVVSSDVTSQEARANLRVPADRIRIVPNTFDERYAVRDAGVRRQARALLQARFGLSIGDEPVLLNVGSDETRKNNVTLFRALADLAARGRKDVILLRVGHAQNTTNRQECKDIADAAGVKAYFVEDVRDEDLGYFYQAADMYVSPTLQEGFGRTVIEAQIVGLPVIASDLPVYRYTMGDSFLAVAQPEDVAAWAEQIGRLADDASLAQRLAQDGRINAQRFSSRTVGALLHRVLDQAVRD
jgi:glycosyltransferase involved in cell wall biosynthesis